MEVMGEKRRKGLLCFPAQSCARGQLGVNAALRDELGVRAALQNAVFADDDDLICVLDGGKAVRDGPLKLTLAREGDSFSFQIASEAGEKHFVAGGMLRPEV